MERDLNMSLQYSRRDTIEITGIPPVIEDQDLEKEVIEIFRDAKVVVDKQPIKASDVFLIIEEPLFRNVIELVKYL